MKLDLYLSPSTKTNLHGQDLNVKPESARRNRSRTLHGVGQKTEAGIYMCRCRKNFLNKSPFAQEVKANFT